MANYIDPLNQRLYNDPNYESIRIREEAEKKIAEARKAEADRLKTAENHVYMHLMECGDPQGIRELTTALAIVRRLVKEALQ